MLDGILALKPLGSNEWGSVVNTFNLNRPSNICERDEDSIRRKFKLMHTMKKPTGTAIIPDRILRAKEIQLLISERSGAFQISDDDDEEVIGAAVDRSQGIVQDDLQRPVLGAFIKISIIIDVDNNHTRLGPINLQDLSRTIVENEKKSSSPGSCLDGTQSLTSRKRQRIDSALERLTSSPRKSGSEDMMSKFMAMQSLQDQSRRDDERIQRDDERIRREEQRDEARIIRQDKEQRAEEQRLENKENRKDKREARKAESEKFTLLIMTMMSNMNKQS